MSLTLTTIEYTATDSVSVNEIFRSGFTGHMHCDLDAILDVSFNVSSTVDNGTGNYFFDQSNIFSDGLGIALAGSVEHSDQGYHNVADNGDISVSRIALQLKNSSGTSINEDTQYHATGDLA